MQLSGLRYGSKLLQLVEFPVADFIDGSATNQEIQRSWSSTGSWW